MINANAIGTFFQRKKGKGVGPLPPIPGLDGVIGLYIAKGLTNDSMKENPVWKDKSGQSNDLQMKNFSWSEMSGVGGYVTMKDKFVYNLDVYSQLWVKSDVKTFNITFKLDLESDGAVFYLDVRKQADASLVKRTAYYESGIYTFNYTYEGDDLVQLSGYNGDSATGRGIFTVTVFPIYQGAIVFDGVNDYGICETFPILTKEKGYTVMALRRWLTYPLNGSAVLISKRKDASLGAFIMERNISVSEPEVSYTFGQRSGISIDNNNLVTYQTTNYYNDQELQVGNSEDTDTLLLGAGFYNNGLPSGYGNFAVYSVVIIDHDATAEERQKVIDYWKQEYPHLFFDQAWTVTGLTNDSPNKTTIKNLTGNGIDLTLNNFAFAGNSGYGLYAQNYISYAITNRAVYTKTNSSIHVTKSITAGVNFTESARDVTIPSYRIKVTGIQSGQEMIYRGSNNTFLTNIPSDGIYVLPAVENGSNLGFQFVSYTGDCNITIEQIPDYEGYLVTDGVDDRIQSSGFKLGKDWTMIGDWKLFEVTKYIAAGIIKAPSLYLYNSFTGLQFFINTSQIPFSVKGIKSVNAICSDGRIYTNDWNEIVGEYGVVTSSNSPLLIGYNNTNFTKIAFKNLAIYNNKVLTKDQCIAGYNLLQTFKNS